MSRRTEVLNLLEDMHEAAQQPEVDWSQVAKLYDDLKPLIEYLYEEWVEENCE